MIDRDQKFVTVSLTFDDVLLLPGYSELVPNEVDVSTIFAGNIRISSPFCSSAMDTVTESRLAIAIAQEGGIGVIHKNMTIERQASEVDHVKRSESGMIIDPFTLGPNETIAHALELMARFRISGVPITEDDKLVGILTNRDLRFLSEDETSAPIHTYMTKDNLVTASEGTTLEQAQAVLQKHRIEKLPVVDAEGRLKGLITIKDIEKKRKFPNASKDDLGRLRVAAAIGVSEQDTDERAGALLEAGVDALVIDTAHGYTKRVGDAVQRAKQNYPKAIIVAGNIATKDGVSFLCDRGVDAVKVGMGPGSICTTRVVSGAGVPQISAVFDCACEIEKYPGVKLIADGGVKFSGDAVKALAAGAHSVMIGGLFAGAEEAPGETIFYGGRTFKIYRGMGSVGAMKEGSKDRYGQTEVTEDQKLVPEGIEGRVPYKGSLSGIIFQLIGGVRAGMGYCGTPTIEELHQKAQFTQVTQASLQESHPHDVFITKEAPNYRLG
ncbi:MAG: IMP dehydrogenase [Candidatus Hinthialibacter antarcticus]|nr:IMP dehydrogenase [Candidatus Hinthialibacter antarcticus]